MRKLSGMCALLGWGERLGQAVTCAGPLPAAPLQRANVYSPIVSVFTLKTKEEPSKWTLASTALLLQDELQ